MRWFSWNSGSPARAGKRLTDGWRRAGPGYVEALADGEWMCIAADGAIAIVVDIVRCELPDDADRKLRCEARADGRAAGWRPVLDRRERHSGPVLGAGRSGRLATTGEVTRDGWWVLRRGDFNQTKFAAPLPDIVFFDPFSFKTDSGLWTLGAFRELANLFAANAVELFTYSFSTSVRSALLASGFYVAKGRGTGPKAETTIGLTPAAAAMPHGRELLGEEWLVKWGRSDAQAPLGIGANDDSWREALIGHPQFQRRS